MSLVSRLRQLWRRLRGRPVLPPGIRIGKGVWIGDASRFDWSHGRHITIEDGAVISTGVRILCHDASCKRRIGATWVAPVRIGARAFVGTECVILPGVTVGADAVVAAGSVVTRDVPPGTVVAGVPAAPVRRTEELDAKRRQELTTKKQFPSDVYERDDLPPELDAELRAAVEQDGGYFMT